MTQEQKRRERFSEFMSALDCVDWGRPVYSLDGEYLDKLVQDYIHGVSRRQTVINFTKWMHGFNVTDVGRDLDYLQGEVDEAKEAWQTATSEDFLRELADIVIYCYGIAQMQGVDLDRVIEEKMQYNLNRSYQKEDP